MLHSVLNLLSLHGHEDGGQHFSGECQGTPPSTAEVQPDIYKQLVLQWWMHMYPAAEVGMHVHHAAKVDVYAAYFDIMYYYIHIGCICNSVDIAI